jgi:CDP-diacylglycerol---serine O-phosphatidyltransferase
MPSYRGLLPGTFTMGNVVCGFVAILQALEGKPVMACWFVMLAAFFDLLDGKVARMSGATSQFGIELDSLADVISFAVAPVVIIYSLKLPYISSMAWMVVGIVYLMSACYRLARFNLFATSEEKSDFKGLPVPAAALFLMSYIIFSFKVWGQIEYQQWVVVMIVGTAFMMATQVPFETVPDRFHTMQNRVKLLVLLTAGVLVLIEPRLLLFPIFGLYILLNVARELYRQFSRGVNRVAGRSSDEDANHEERE